MALLFSELSTELIKEATEKYHHRFIKKELETKKVMYRTAQHRFISVNELKQNMIRVGLTDLGLDGVSEVVTLDFHESSKEFSKAFKAVCTVVVSDAPEVKANWLFNLKESVHMCVGLFTLKPAIQGLHSIDTSISVEL